LTASSLDRPATVNGARQAPRAQRQRLVLRIVSFVLLLVAWETASRLTGARALPTVEAVAVALVDEIRHDNLLHHLAVTLGRVFAAFVIAMGLGSALGLAMGRWRLLDLALDGWVVLLLNLPALVVAILAYVWFGLTEAAAIGAVTMNKLPLVAMTMREGTRALDRDLEEMAAIFRLSAWRRFRHVVAPQLAPFFLVAARSGLSLIWKIVLLVELLGRSDGIGFLIQLYFQLFDVPRILACALAFVAVVQLIEWGALQPLERRAGAWRR
jgi:NitT/TauT family transport system permease protein